MVRTKADACGVRVASAKATRKNIGGSSGGSSSFSAQSPASKKDKFSGGNPVCPRETPDWQKPINEFFTMPKNPKKDKENVIPEDKENQAPESCGSSKQDKISDDDIQPCSSSSKNKSKIRRISDSDSDSEPSEKKTMVDCVATVNHSMSDD